MWYYFQVRCLIVLLSLSQRRYEYKLHSLETLFVISLVLDLSGIDLFAIMVFTITAFTSLRTDCAEIKFQQGERIKVVECSVGDNLMRVAQSNNIDVEGACEASLACCTCHVYMQQDKFDSMEPASEQEEDLLDLAPFLKPTSRLSCQITIDESHDGMIVQLPPATRNFYVDGFTPKPH
ncbi:hypothetical protein GJ496_006089 [Pomphorhynchus laevis]|nr:hypothetical protein GJ496_006089 [Pomphorhynchus laevis]